MERRSVRQAGILIILAVTGIVLAVAGNLASNLVAVAVPSSWADNALSILGIVALAECTVALLLGRVQSFASAQDPRRRSRLRRVATIVLIVLAELLAAALGAVSNVAASQLPTQLTPVALPLFAGVTVGVVILAVLVYLVQSGPPVEETNRAHFIKKLQTRYNDRRQDALRDALLIVLGLHEAPDAVTWPALDLGTPSGLQEPADAHQVPPGTPISEVYDQADGRLLILGAPGAGKTTLLVELAITLLGRARADRRTPVPVIFNLSTWAVNRPPLEKWMAEDLVYSYQVPQGVARTWVATDAVLPLLDGFDEVAEAHRAACAEAINAFVRAHPRLSLVVCSRTAEYRAQPVHLALRAAVVVQPLSDDQIAAYLANGGERLRQLREAVEADADLRDLLRTPLLLRLVILTYGDLPRKAIPPVGGREAWRQQLFGEYVARMLERERNLEQRAAYSPEQTEDYLGWLARQMRAHGLVEFYLERMQPDWLPDTRTRLRYLRAGNIVPDLVVGIGGGLLLVSALGAILGVMLGVMLAPILWEILWLIVALIFGLGLPLVGSLVNGPDLEQRVDELAPIELVPAVQWSWRTLVRELIRFLVLGLFLGLVFGLGYWLVNGPPGGLGNVLYGYLVASLVIALFLGLIAALASALQSRPMDEHDYHAPAEGVRRSLQNTVPVVLLGGLVAGLLDGALLGLRPDDPLDVKVFAVLIASGWVFVIFLYVSGVGDPLSPAARHAALRWQLRRAGVVPPHLVRFLDYAADHVLLQKIGGGYRFIHALLRDYFADLSPQGHKS